MVSQELLQKFLGFIHEMPQIRTIIVFEETHKGPLSSLVYENILKIVPFEEVLTLENSLEVFHNLNYWINFIQHRIV